MKALAYENLMKLSESDLTSLFPFGAAQNKDSRWRPCEEGEAEISLRELLRRKRKLVEKPRYLRASYSVPPQYVKNKSLDFKPEESHGNYTLSPAKALKDEQGAVEPISQEDYDRFAKEARSREAVVHAEEKARSALRSQMARMRGLAIERIKSGNDPTPIFEQALEQLEDEREAA